MTTEVVSPDEVAVQSNADLQAGFDSVATGEPLPPATPATEAEPVTEEPGADAAEAPPIEVPAEPEIVSLTKTQWDEAQTKLARIDALEKSLTDSYTRTNGQLGAFNQALRDLKGAQGGRKVGIEQFKKLSDEFGEDMAASLVEGLNATVAAETPTEAPAPAPVDTATADQFRAIQENQQLLEIKLALTAVDPNWKALTNSPAFIAWRDAHPPEVAEEIRSGRDAEYLADALKGFKGHLKTEADKADATKQKTKQNTSRLAAAITQPGAPPASRAPHSDSAEFQKGFDSVQ